MTEPTTGETAPTDQGPAEQVGIVCGWCGRKRTLADDYDYTPMQIFTGRKLGWFNGDGEQMCGECLAAMMRGEMP